MTEFILIMQFMTELLRTFNLIYSDIPVQQRRANFFLTWNLFKPLIMARLTEDQKKAVESAMATLAV